ncbi:hypothetical protein EG329_004210, partial [Mollisiaceae sp. DMI_Dod_QoI]
MPSLGSKLNEPGARSCFAAQNPLRYSDIFEQRPESQFQSSTTSYTENLDSKYLYDLHAAMASSLAGFGKLSSTELAEFLAMLLKIAPASAPKKPERQHGLRLPIIRPPEGCEETKVHRFDYAPLPTPTSIRLLKLFPLNNPKDEFDLYRPIQCSIIVQDLDESLVGAANRAELEIPLPAGCIWIDALCIDQENLKERGEQVLMMSRIYKQAQNVKFWLGGEDAIARSAVTTVRQMGTIDLGRATELNSLKITDESAYKRFGLPVFSKRQWVELYAFLNRSWFSRAWIVQELAFAKTAVFFCGLFAIELSGFAHFLIFLSKARWTMQIRKLAEPCIKGCRPEHYFNIRSPDLNEDIVLYQDRPQNLFDQNRLQRILDTRATMGISDTNMYPREGVTPRPIWIVLQSFRSTESADPRDKIYAFVGLSREFSEKVHLTGDAKLMPSYEKSAREVYIETSKFIMGSMGSLELLSLRQDEVLAKIKDLPSWVPDFSATHPNPLDENGLTPWTASEGLGVADIRYHPGDALEVRGVKVGEIRLVQSFFWGELVKLADLFHGIPKISEVGDPKMNEKVREYLRRADVPLWLPFREETLECSEAGGTMQYQYRFEVLWRTMLTDCFDGKHPAPAECGAVVQAEMEGIVVNRMFVAAAIWVGKDYTAWQILQGHYSDDSGNILYPPEFSTFIKRLEASRINGTDEQCVVGFVEEMLDRKVRLEEGSLRTEVNAKISMANSGKLFVTAQGYLGSGPRSVKTGDEVWVITGSSVPLILRRNEGDKYRLPYPLDR